MRGLGLMQSRFRIGRIIRTKWLFPQLGLLFVGFLVARALIFGVCVRAHNFWKLPDRSDRS